MSLASLPDAAASSVHRGARSLVRLVDSGLSRRSVNPSSRFLRPDLHHQPGEVLRGTPGKDLLLAPVDSGLVEMSAETPEELP